MGLFLIVTRWMAEGASSCSQRPGVHQSTSHGQCRYGDRYSGQHLDKGGNLFVGPMARHGSTYVQ